MDGEKKKGRPAEEVVFFEKDNVKITFTDVVQVNVSQETVILNLALRDQNEEKAEINHKVYMTLPHFIRFADLCGNISNDIKQQIEANYAGDKT